MRGGFHCIRSQPRSRCPQRRTFSAAPSRLRQTACRFSTRSKTMAERIRSSQPRARGVREATEPLRGARITEFRVTSPQHYELVYIVNGREAKIRYGVEPDGSYLFEFVENGRSQSEVYKTRAESADRFRGPGK